MMSYRVRLGKIAKPEQDKYKGKSVTECLALVGGDEHQLHQLKAHTQLYEIGKHVSFDKDELKSFYDFDIKAELDCEFHILTKEGLIKLIAEYKAEIALYYKGLSKQLEKAVTESESKAVTLPPALTSRLLMNIRGKSEEWNNEHYSIVQFKDDMDGEITTSWSMEYALWNIVHILKTFDWENDYLIYSGW